MTIGGPYQKNGQRIALRVRPSRFVRRYDRCDRTGFTPTTVIQLSGASVPTTYANPTLLTAFFLGDSAPTSNFYGPPDRIIAYDQNTVEPDTSLQRTLVR